MISPAPRVLTKLLVVAFLYKENKISPKKGQGEKQASDNERYSSLVNPAVLKRYWSNLAITL